MVKSQSERTGEPDQIGYGAADERVTEETPSQDQPQHARQIEDDGSPEELRRQRDAGKRPGGERD